MKQVLHSQIDFAWWQILVSKQYIYSVLRLPSSKRIVPDKLSAYFSVLHSSQRWSGQTRSLSLNGVVILKISLRLRGIVL